MDPEAALREALAREGEPAYLLDRRGVVRFVNDAWDRAARADGAPQSVHAASVVGTDWLGGIQGKARRYYAALLSRALAMPASSPPRALVHLTESNSPVSVRVVSHRFVPLHGERGESADFVLVVHAPVVETKVEGHYPVIREAGARYLQGDGAVLQCSSCRRTRTGAGLAGEGGWEFAPELILSAPEGTRWHVCPDCRVRYYGRPSDEALKRTVAARLPRSVGLWLSAKRLPVALPDPDLAA